MKSTLAEPASRPRIRDEETRSFRRTQPPVTIDLAPRRTSLLTLTPYLHAPAPWPKGQFQIDPEH